MCLCNVQMGQYRIMKRSPCRTDLIASICCRLELIRYERNPWVLPLLVHPGRMRDLFGGGWALYSTIPMCSMRTLTYVRNRMERSKDRQTLRLTFIEIAETLSVRPSLLQSRILVEISQQLCPGSEPPRWPTRMNLMIGESSPISRRC